MVLGGNEMKVKLMGHTQASYQLETLLQEIALEQGVEITDGQAVALSAIRTCYSHNEPSKIVQLEGKKYFGNAASDGEGGTDADRLIRHIIKSGHTSTMEHLNFSFAVEGVSRSLLAQLTRHRHFSFSVQSQRYVKMEKGSKKDGFDFVFPPSVWKDETTADIFATAMNRIQEIYDLLRSYGVPAEDARYVLPNAATCNLVLTGNLRSILDFYSKRSSKQAQWEIRDLAEELKAAVVDAEPWTESFFG